jgi:large subunit ribosomal protein L21
MYAVVRHGGHQYRVAPGDRLVVDRLHSEVGAVVGLEPVLLLSDGDGVRADAASLEGIRVAATVAGHRRGRKIRVFTFKPKKRHRRTLGFRAELTELVVDRVLAKGEPLPEPVEVEELQAEEIEPEVVAVEETQAEPAEPARPRRRGARAAAAAAGVAEAAADTSDVSMSESDTATTPPVRRRRTAKPDAEVEPAAAGEPPVPIEPAEHPEGTVPAVGEAAAVSRPARRNRKPAAAVEPEPAKPEESSPSSGVPGARRRRVERTTSPPEAGE